MTSQRLSEAATRSLVVPVILILFGIVKGRFTIEIPPTPETVMILFVFGMPWIMVTIWQVRSRVERWTWTWIGIGYGVCLFVVALLVLISVRLFTGV